MSDSEVSHVDLTRTAPFQELEQLIKLMKQTFKSWSIRLKPEADWWYRKAARKFPNLNS